MNMPQSQTPIPINNDSLEVLQPSQIEALERAQIDVQVATAHKYPRSLQQFRQRSMSMACLDAETAETCIYCRPVGKEQNAQGKWVEKFAEGASIRLAEIVAASYGNIRAASRIIEQTERFVRCEGVCHDLETNYAGKSECVEATVKKDGTPYSERQRALVAKVCLAKAYRDAIFKVVPRALCKPVLDAAKKVAAGQGLSIEERRKKVRAWITQLKIDESRMFAALDVNGWDEVGENQLMTLTGLKTSMADGDISIEEAFPAIQSGATGTTPTPKPSSSAPAPVNVVPMKPAATPAPAPAPAEAPKPVAAVATQPASEPEAEKAVETAPETVATPTPEQAPEGQEGDGTAPEPSPATVVDPKDAIEATTFITTFATRDGVNEDQIMAYLRSTKPPLAKAGQKLSDMSSMKLVAVAKGWNTPAANGKTICQSVKELAGVA